ncbi:hypothetical protein CY35_13G006000 [Sphagnum magellanicum]|nr:hypothetical protein CY35_13G006000 [Sphagnum magellanicum]
MTGQRRKLQKQGTRGSRAANEGNETGAEKAGDDQERGIMEGFPVELISNIFSHLDDMKDVVRASWTCRKWRVALCYLHTLCASWTNWELETENFEFVLTDTILQTTGLQKLQIHSYTSFPAAPVIAWLSHIGDSLRHLTYKLPGSTPHINVLESCARMRRLQRLDLHCLNWGDIKFVVADPTAELFPCLLSLHLSDSRVSTGELQSLVWACQKLESLSLSWIRFSDPDFTLNLRSLSLKSLVCYFTGHRNVVLEANLLESFHLWFSNFTTFEVTTGIRLRSLQIRKLSIANLDLGDNTDCPDLEEVVVDTCERVWATIQCFLLKSSSTLRKLQLYGIPLSGNHPVNLNLGTISCLFPCLTHLGLSYKVVDNNSPIVESQFQGSTVFEGVQFFELRYPGFDENLVLMMGRVLKRCPNLKKLQVVSNLNMDRRYIHDIMASFVALVRKFSKVDFQFEKVIC